MNLKRPLFIPGVSPPPTAEESAEPDATAAAPESATAEATPPVGRPSVVARLLHKREARIGVAALLSIIILAGVLFASSGKKGKLPPPVGIPNPDAAQVDPEKKDGDKETEKEKDKTADEATPKPKPSDVTPPDPVVVHETPETEPKPDAVTPPKPAEPVKVAEADVSEEPKPEPKPDAVTPPQPAEPVKTAEAESAPAQPDLAPSAAPDSTTASNTDPAPAPIEMQPSANPVVEPKPATAAAPDSPAEPAPASEPIPAPTPLPIEPMPAANPDPALPQAEQPAAPAEPLPMPTPTPMPAPDAQPAAPDSSATRAQVAQPVDPTPVPSIPRTPEPRPQLAPVPKNETPDLATPSDPSPAAGWVPLPNMRGSRMDSSSVVPDVEPADGAVTADPGTKELVEPVPHVVQRGENFWTIAKLYYNSGRYWKALWAANRQKVPVYDQLYVGTTIRIPPPELLDQSLVEAPKAARPVAPVTAAPVPLRRTSRPVLNASRAGTAARATHEAEALPPETDRDDDERPAKARFVDRDAGPDLALEAELDPDAADGKYEVNRPIYKVRPYDTLRSIARDNLGNSRRADEVLEINSEIIDDPNHLIPGQLIELPEDARARRRRNR